MATETADNGNVEGTTGSVPRLAYVVAVGGGDPKAKTRKYIGRKGRVTSRYLRPKIASCHDRCKSGVRDETPELKKPGRRLGVRKIWVKKKPVRRSVEPVKRNKMSYSLDHNSTDYHGSKGVEVFVGGLARSLTEEKVHKLEGKKIGVLPSAGQDTLFLGNLNKGWSADDFNKVVRQVFPDIVSIDLAQPSGS
ncbi:hypothetical protein M8C21_000877, partial [Ambrosia artemisiifolia]